MGDNGGVVKGLSASSSPTAALLQEGISTTNSSSAIPSGTRSAAGITLLVGLPVVLIIVTAVVILLLVLVWLNYRSKHKDRGYQTVPTEDTGQVMSLPYPTGKRPKINMGDPPIPGTTTHYVEAAQLGEVTGSRYPFVDKESTTKTPEKEGKKTRSRRSKPLDIRRKSTDCYSDTSEDGCFSPRLSSSPGPRSARVTPPPSPSPVHRGSVREEELAELFIALSYQENETTLKVKIERASNLPYHADGTPVDPYVRIFFIPNLPELPQRRTTKTHTQRRENFPVFNEVVQYEAMSAEELINSNLHLEVLDHRSYGKDVVLGLANLPLVQVQFVKGEASMTLPLKPPKVRENLGTILVSISYTPDTKKLGVILLRAKDLNKGNSRETDVQAKIWITVSGDRVLGRLRTKKKAQSCSPIFNEALTCTVEPLQVKNVAVNISMLNDSRYASKKELGQVIICGQCSGEEFRHWNDVMATPGKHIAEWHELR